jgi:hypothetical protein
MKLIATILFALALTGCATGQYEAYTQTTTAEDDLHQADGVGGATAVAVPVARWAGMAILQMLQNLKVNIDVKLDNPQNAKD